MAQITDAIGPDSAEAYSAAWRVGSLHSWCQTASFMLELKGIPRDQVTAEHAALSRIEALASELAELLSASRHAPELFPSPDPCMPPRLWADSAIGRSRALRHELEHLQHAARAAKTQARPRRGPPVNVGRAVFTENLCRTLMILGLPFQTAEDSAMVQACAIVWAALEIPGDARDTLRRAEKMFGIRARLAGELIEVPQPAPRRSRKGRNST